MNTQSFRRCFVVLMLLFSLSVAACQPIVAPADQANTLLIAISEDSTTLDPARAYESLPTIVHKAVYQTLLTFPPDAMDQVIPVLAKSWEMSPDGAVYTFELDENARFSNGDPVKASDVVFSFNRLKNVKGAPA
jgi:peptide/nickel transport system substrate-binding protein